MSPAEAQAVVHRFVEAINRQDWLALAKILAPNFRRHSIAAGDAVVESAADLIRFLKSEYVTFPDAHEEIVATFSDGTMVSARHRFRGTHLGALGPHPATGKQLRSEYLAIYRMENGLIAEAWAEWDNLASLRQLGLISGAV